MIFPCDSVNAKLVKLWFRECGFYRSHFYISKRNDGARRELANHVFQQVNKDSANTEFTEATFYIRQMMIVLVWDLQTMFFSNVKSNDSVNAELAEATFRIRMAIAVLV